MKVRTARYAGYLLTAIFVAMIAFQALLVLGLPLGEGAWGGRHAELPTELRIASAAAMVVFLFLIVVVQERLGRVSVLKRPKLVSGILWFFAIYLLLNGLANAFSPAPLERYVMAPAALLSSYLLFIVVRSDASTR